MTVSVLPVPVAPETRITESRKKPPPHISSSSALPDVIRTFDDFCCSWIADSGITTTPPSGTIVNGYSPFWWSVPRNFRISIVRRRLLVLEHVAQDHHVVGDELLDAVARDRAVVLGALGGEHRGDAHAP